MGTHIRRRQDPQAPLVLAPRESLRSEIRGYLSAVDRPTVIFWATQIACWLAVVVVAMVWGLGG